jgi:hypothetical protein
MSDAAWAWCGWIWLAWLLPEPSTPTPTSAADERRNDLRFMQMNFLSLVYFVNRVWMRWIVINDLPDVTILTGGSPFFAERSHTATAIGMRAVFSKCHLRDRSSDFPRHLCGDPRAGISEFERQFS